MIATLERTDYSHDIAKSVYQSIVDSCHVCTQSGTVSSKKIAFSHICEAFSNEIKTKFMFATIQTTKWRVLHVIDNGTSYCESVISS